MVGGKKSCGGVAPRQQLNARQLQRQESQDRQIQRRAERRRRNRLRRRHRRRQLRRRLVRRQQWLDLQYHASVLGVDPIVPSDSSTGSIVSADSDDTESDSD
jgi:hypothetical protein